MGIDQPLISNFRTFLKSCPRHYDFPMGGSTVLPLESELQLVVAIQMVKGVSKRDCDEFRQLLNVRDAYSLVIFSVRMAVLAVRKQDSSFLRTGLIGLVLDDGVVDWRDVIVALAIIEDCSARIAINSETVIESVLGLATTQRRSDICTNYLTRPSNMRSVEVLGFCATGENESLSYIAMQ